jgi:hypothetical protein
MTELLNWMSSNPGLTIFIIIVGAITICDVFSYIAIAIKGHPPVEKQEEGDDE